jgi:hypothetical protein
VELLDELESVFGNMGALLVVAVDVAPLVAGGAGNSNVRIGVVLALMYDGPSYWRPLSVIHLFGAEDAFVDGDDLIALRVVEGQTSLAIQDHGLLFLSGLQLRFACSDSGHLLRNSSSSIEFPKLVCRKLFPKAF